MKTNILIFILLLSVVRYTAAQEKKKFKKRVLENTEIDLLTSFYAQNGSNAAVTGGIGSEELKDFANDINISIPINADDVLSINATVSAYSSASSSNLNPFSGASKGGDDDEDEEEDDDFRSVNDDDNRNQIAGSPWIVSSGASKSDVWLNLNMSYAHSSNDRNKIYNAHLSIANEFDYFSLGGGIGFTKLFNKKNTEISIGTIVYLDHWRPQYPTEIKTYIKNNGNLNADYFNGISILDQNGNVTNKNGLNTWRPVSDGLIKDKGRNTYAVSLSFSQILSKKLQMSVFADITYQNGWLANPMQRVYFADRPNYYIGNPNNIKTYTQTSNTETFQLADDYERLPTNRLKFPIGTRLHYYINERLVLRTYYRFYADDWGIQSHTIQITLPVKVSEKFTLYPNYRFYNQTAADYFAPYEEHLSTQTFYTSDYDLSAFSANQFGLGVKYTDIFTKIKLWKFGIKTIHLDFNHYNRTTGLSANIISLGVKMIGN